MNKRLRGLLALLLILLLARWWDPFPPAGDGPATVSAAIERSASAGHSAINEAVMPAPAAYASSSATPHLRQAEPANAFEVRGATSPTDSPAAMNPAPRMRRVVLATAIESTQTTPPPEPVQPPPPFQVIGTWNDGKNPGVFVVSSSGTLLARLGQPLLADYQVERISPQELVLKQLSNQREWALPIPQPANRPPMVSAK